MLFCEMGRVGRSERHHLHTRSRIICRGQFGALKSAAFDFGLRVGITAQHKMQVSQSGYAKPTINSFLLWFLQLDLTPS